MLPDNDVTWKIIGSVAVITIIATVSMAFDVGKNLISLPEPRKIDVPAALKKAPDSFAAETPVASTPRASSSPTPAIESFRKVNP